MIEDDAGMAWVRFRADFDFFTGPVCIAYKAGWEGLVKRACADQAVALSVAETIPVPPSASAAAHTEPEPEIQPETTPEPETAPETPAESPAEDHGDSDTPHG